MAHEQKEDPAGKEPARLVCTASFLFREPLVRLGSGPARRCARHPHSCPPAARFAPSVHVPCTVFVSCSGLRLIEFEYDDKSFPIKLSTQASLESWLEAVVAAAARLKLEALGKDERLQLSYQKDGRELLLADPSLIPDEFGALARPMIRCTRVAAQSKKKRVRELSAGTRLRSPCSLEIQPHLLSACLCRIWVFISPRCV